MYPPVVSYDPSFTRFAIEGRIIRYCPWCGTKLPDENMPTEFAVAPNGEHEQLVKKAASVRDASHCLALLGEADYNEWFPGENGEPTETRNIEYHSLSDWYTLEFYIQREEVRFVIHPKWIPIPNGCDR